MIRLGLIRREKNGTNEFPQRRGMCVLGIRLRASCRSPSALVGVLIMALKLGILLNS